MDRGRDRRYDDRGYGGETYRPSDRNGPSGYRGLRSPPRRGRTPPSLQERYAPGSDRRRSRSPRYGARAEDSYRRPRSPPPKALSPRRDERARSPPPRSRRYSRSPVRHKSPPPSRRDPSPYDRRPRCPPSTKSRAFSPRSRYERRPPYSPPRQPRPRYPEENNYRPRDRTRTPPSRRPDNPSRAQSPISSRRSSPPVHPDRLAQTNPRQRSPVYREARPPNGTQDSPIRPRSPARNTYTSTKASPPGETAHQRSPPCREREAVPVYENGSKYVDETIRPRSTAYNNGDSHPIPSGPSAGYRPDSHEPLSAPASSTTISMSAHNRPSSSILSAPTRPRGNASFARADSRDHPYGGPSHRGGRLPSAAPYRGASRSSYDSRGSPSEYAPNGRHNSQSSGPPPSSYGAPRHGPPFRTNNSTSTTYPRTQRFATNHLASVPSIIPGGKALPSADPAAAKKINQLEEDAEKLRKQIDEKQRIKRAELREWDTRQRESERENLRSQLAEAQLQRLSGEVIGGTAF